MKIVYSSDWHTDARLGGVSRFEEVEAAAAQVTDAAITMCADFFIFGGDLCDPDDPREVLRALTMAQGIAIHLRDHGINSVWVAGNHDVIESKEIETTLSPLRALENLETNDGEGVVYVVESPRLIGVLGLSLLVLPYTPATRPYDTAEEAKRLLAKDPDSRVVSVSHLSVPGVIPGEETTEMPRGREVMFPTEVVKPRAKVMLQGHYHRRQTTADGIQIVGSLARFTFGEEDHTPSFLVVEV